MRLSEIVPGARVTYVPTHANGDLNHPDVEHGTVSSKNGWYVFVRFDAAAARLGWDGIESKACRAEDLVGELE